MGRDTYEERYRAFIQNSSEGIWLFELDVPVPISLSIEAQIEHLYKHAYLAETNEAAAAMYGPVSPEDQIGGRLAELLPKEDPHNIEYLSAFIAAGYRLSDAESHEKDAHGQDKYFRNSLTGVLKNGHLHRVWGTQRDITEQHLTTEALKKSEERLALALNVSDTGIWEWTKDTGAFVWTEELRTIFGLKQQQKITSDTYINLIHPEDKDRLLQNVRQAINTGGEYQIEHRIIRPDGSLHWVASRGKSFLLDGQVTRVLGTARSIDDKKRQAELEEINQKLRDQQQQLLQLSRSKDEFISLASHQLRTPATGVKQYIGLLLEGYVGELTKEQAEMLRTAYDGNERQLTIINDMLRVAQLDAGKVRLNKAELNISKMLTEVAEEQTEKFTDKQQALILDLPKQPLEARADAARIRMVFENLIDNAHKYSPPSKTILVKAYIDDQNVVVEVIDEGVGIRKSDMSKLFQKFSRLDNTPTKNVDGTGLGLYWAKKIVALHNGTLTIKSRPRAGSTFVISIPIR